MKNLSKILIFSLVAIFMASCSSTLNQRQVADDLYGSPNQEKMVAEAQSEENDFAKNMNAKANDFLKNDSLENQDTTIYSDEEASTNPYDRLLVDDYEEAYERRTEGRKSPSYRMPNNYSTYLSDDYWYASSFDPAFYNVMVMGDEVWVEPNWLSTSFISSYGYGSFYRKSYYNSFYPFSSFSFGYTGYPSYYSPYRNYAFNTGFYYGLGYSSAYYSSYYGYPYYYNSYSDGTGGYTSKRKSSVASGYFGSIDDDSKYRPVRGFNPNDSKEKKITDDQLNRKERPDRKDIRKDPERPVFKEKPVRAERPERGDFKRDLEKPDGKNRYISVERPDDKGLSKSKPDRKYIRPVRVGDDKKKKPSFERVRRNEKPQFNQKTDFSRFRRNAANERAKRSSAFNERRRPQQSGNFEALKEKIKKSNSSNNRSSFSPSRKSSNFNNSSSSSINRSKNSSSSGSNSSSSSSSSSSSRPSRKKK